MEPRSGDAPGRRGYGALTERSAGEPGSSLIPLAPRLAVNWRATIFAGIAAGVAASGMQLLLWWSFWDVLPEILYRDARLTAALVMGRGVLPPPSSLDWSVMAVATLIHFSLSIVYSMILAIVISGRGRSAALFLGSIYGLALFGINMYGVTAIIPWFTAARDWITLVTHVIFGLSSAIAYREMSARC